MTFPCVGPGAKEWHLDEAKLAEYRETYPGVDVLVECRTRLKVGLAEDDVLRQPIPWELIR